MAAVRVLTPREAAALMQGDVRLLADWRAKGGGPRHTMVGGMVRYRLHDVFAFLRAERRATQRLAEKLAYQVEAARRAEGKPSYMQPTPRD